MILFTGKGSSGSWKIRGDQLGSKLGDAIARASFEDMQASDAIVLVKRPAPGMIQDIHRSKKPWFWDVVDFYPQPQCTKWGRDEAIRWVHKQIDAFKPSGVIWPNEKMASDCSRDSRDLVLYHHFRPALFQRRVSDDVCTVGYEGSPAYLGEWEHEIRRECRRLGWQFKKTGTPQDFDICVAFRGRHVDGYAQRHWKSNVKLANCHATGAAFIGSPESAYKETAAGGEIFCNNPDELAAAFDALKYKPARKRISESFVSAAYPLDKASYTLAVWLADKV